METKDIKLIQRYAAVLIEMHERMNKKQRQLVNTIITTSLDIIDENTI